MKDSVVLGPFGDLGMSIKDLGCRVYGVGLAAIW